MNALTSMAGGFKVTVTTMTLLYRKTANLFDVQ